MDILPEYLLEANLIDSAEPSVRQTDLFHEEKEHFTISHFKPVSVVALMLVALQTFM